MTGYSSSYSKSTGNTINTTEFSTEFTALQAAFHATTGHGHTGAAGDGPTISLSSGTTGTLPLVRGGTNAALVDPNADRILFWDDSAGAVTWLVPAGNLLVSTTNMYVQETIIIAIGDETTSITTGTAKVTWRNQYAFTVTAVAASLTTASSSGLPTFDINEAGTTILSTKLTIDANETTSATAATAAVVSDSTLAAGAEMTADIDVAGTGAKGAKLYITGYRTA